MLAKKSVKLSCYCDNKAVKKIVKGDIKQLAKNWFEKERNLIRLNLY